MVNRKSILYRQAREIARTLRIAPPVYRNATIQSLQQFIEQNSRPNLPFLDEIRNYVRGIKQLRLSNQTVEQFIQQVRALLQPNQNYYCNFLNDNGDSIRLRRAAIITSASSNHKLYDLYNMLMAIMLNNEEYDVGSDYIDIQFHKQVTINPPLRNQRDGKINCACKLVIDHLNEHPSKRNEYRIKNIMKINEKYLKTGIDDNGLQELANKSQIKLVIKDKLREVWNDFIPKSKGCYKTLLLISHNNHISTEEPYDSEDDDDDLVIQDLDEFEYSIQINDDTMLEPDQQYQNLEIKWFDDSQDVVKRANKYENEGLSGIPIISKGKLVAYITTDVVWKTKFHEYEAYPNCFTSGGIGKAKFIQQYPEYTYGITDSDPFYKLLMDADRSGFYSRTGESKKEHTKYDQNKAYKSFSRSGIFNGFPIIEGIFKIEKNFSDTEVAANFKHGLLYVEWDTLTKDKLNEKIYYEASGWYPIEIVKEYYHKYGINPYIKSYAYASQTFDVDFQRFTNEQFRTFLGKCTSKSFDECWITKSYLEYMRARYILKDRITSFNYSDGFYNITYTSDKKPWNMPVISAYVKAHQKFNLFEQYNKLIENGIVPIAVSVDGIEVEHQCDHLFDIGKNSGQWKRESIYTDGSKEPSVIERSIPEPMGQIEFCRDLILKKFTHVCGAGGNGKSEFIVNLAKVYKSMMFCAPTHGAVKNLIERSDQLGVKINAATYHRVFGINCHDTFQRDRYTHFVIDECSMIPANILREIMNKMSPTQSLVLAGDFWQLPCIDQTPIFDNWTGKMSPEYEKFDKRELTKNWRQKEDPEFFDLCNKLRGSLSKDEAREIIDKLNTRVTSKDKLPNFDSLDDIYIAGINEQVNIINKKYKFKVGCKIISNMTCKDLEGNTVTNGDVGILLNLSPLRIQWHDNKISTFRSVGKNKSGKQRFTMAYGQTVHKAQGRTIKRHVVINPTRLFSKNHLYVALTRAIKFSNVYLTNPITMNTFSKTVQVCS